MTFLGCIFCEFVWTNTGLISWIELVSEFVSFYYLSDERVPAFDFAILTVGLKHWIPYKIVEVNK
jgi:hypothetical protein